MQTCNRCLVLKSKEHFHKRSSKTLRRECKECHSDQTKLWASKNRVKMNEYNKIWRKKNSEKLSKSSVTKVRARLKNDVFFKFKHRLRTLIKNSIRSQGYTKQSKTYTIVGTDAITLLNHLWDRFEYTYGIPRGFVNLQQVHIDHIIPVTTAKTEEELLKLNHYSNLQFLLAEDNLSKGARIEYGV